jgi:nitrous oxidase accessory protein NosD
VTLDLGGHTIAGAGGESVGVMTWGERATVANGTIRGFGKGVWSDGADGVLVSAATLERNGVGVDCDYSAGCSVNRSRVRANTVGVSLSAPDGGEVVRSFVTENRVYDNGIGISLTEYLVTVSANRVERNDVGVRIDYSARVTMSQNVVAENTGDGVRVTFMSRATITGNRVERNGGNGVYLEGDFFFGGSTIATVRGNTVTRNGDDGILATNAVRGNEFTVERNRTDRNGDDGIDVEAGGDAPPDAILNAVVGGNRTFHNRDLGIEADPGTTDGGGNHARGNGNPAQCIGVRCK